MEEISRNNGERIIWSSSEHWMKYIRPYFVYVLLMLTSFVLLSVAQFSNIDLSLSSASFFCGIALLLFAHHWFFWLMLGETQARIIVTNKRVIHVHEKILQRNDLIEVAYEKMKTVEAHKTTITQNILNYGTVQFETGAKVYLVPRPNEAVTKIQQAMGLR